MAVALEGSICLLSNQGSFCWRQSVVLVQSLEAIKWTGSGDGIIAVGTEAVLWKRKSRAWEIAWKFSGEQPQNLVSATWATEGQVATAHYSNESSSSLSRCVLVSQSDRRSGVVKTELRHPQPVSMIQWRPSSGIDTHRDVLLTCCLDGTVRLWSEIDNRSAKKTVRDFNDQKSVRPSFHVTAVIEVNQSLNGTLGVDTFVTWASDIGGMFDTDVGVATSFSSNDSEYDTTVKCEWLIVFGPQMLLTYLAVHCLEEISPLRFQRVNLWRRQELLGSRASGSSLQGSGINMWCMFDLSSTMTSEVVPFLQLSSLVEKMVGIGLHDFRCIATGKTRQRNSNVAESPTHHTRSGTLNQVGEHNNGILWYIPKAHQGSITRVATIPHTSLFLTGSKDGDVKLWDAKRSVLVFHWPKLHERHTFLQPSSRGFGGVVQDAVTDIQVLPHGFLTWWGWHRKAYPTQRHALQNVKNDRKEEGNETILARLLLLWRYLGSRQPQRLCDYAIRYSCKLLNWLRFGDQGRDVHS